MLVPNSDLAMTLEAHEHVAFVTPGGRINWCVRKAAPHLKRFMARNGNETGAGPAQQEALGKRDVLESILRNLGGSNYREAGRAAARSGCRGSRTSPWGWSARGGADWVRAKSGATLKKIHGA